MRIRSILGALIIASLPAMPVLAEDMTPEQIKKLVDEAVEKKMKEHERREGPAERAMEERKGQGAAQYPTPTGPMTDIKVERAGEEKVSLGFGSTGSGRLIYAKPFVSSPKAVVGGYMDIQYRSQRQSSIGNDYGGTASNFDQQRFVPFIFADITEHVKFASELEIEHGIRESEGSNEISLEFAHIDYLVNEPFNIRAGILLVPIGKFNLLHDSPLNDLTDRPLVSQLVIPTTMSETGAGFYGTFYPGRTGKLDYELYFSTGPCSYESDGSPRISEQSGTKNSRQRKCPAGDGFDINSGKAVSGRLAYSPMLGVEVAGSGYYGNGAPSGNYNPLSIFALDWTLQRGPFELIGEAAWAYSRGNSRAIQTNSIGSVPGSLLTGIGKNSGPGIPPQRMNGFYIQGNYHFMPDFLAKFSPKRFGPGSTFTAVIRYDRVNTNLDNSNGTGGSGNLEQISFGLNYRPVEDTVFKISYQYQPMAFNPNTDQRIHDSAFVVSAATYF